MKTIYILVAAIALTGCGPVDDATIARHNMAKAADNFEIVRRVILYNAITDKIVMVTEGKCSVSPGTHRTSVVCKVGDGKYLRNFYGKSDNTSYIVEQMESVAVNVYHYRRTFKPQALLPDIDFRGSAEALRQAVTPDSKD